jgi:hypothetical protein
VSFDPKGNEPASDPGPMSIEIPGKTAMLLVKLAAELGAKTPGQVVAHALGLLQTVREAKARNQRIVLKDPQTGREIDLAL